MTSGPHNNFDNSVKPTWCLGCGNFGIWVALKNALAAMGLKNEEVVIVGDVGCSSKITNYVKTNAFEGLHGRAIPAASGVKMGNHKLNVIAVGGDGGIYGEGGNHLIHAARRNQDLTVIVHDNRVYALTKGQPSPTSDQGYKSSITPEGALEIPYNPLLIALAARASFVARGFAGDNTHLTKIITEAINHKGFALVDVLQPCVSFNHINTFSWYYERVYKLDDDPEYNPANFSLALEKAQEWGEKIPLGIIYREERPTYEQGLSAIQAKPLTSQDIKDVNIDSLLNALK